MNRVVHYITSIYLTVTETWIYGQVKNLERYEPVVYCHGTNNLDIYPTERVRSFGIKGGYGGPWTFFCKSWNKAFKFYPPFPFFLLKDRPRLIHAHFGPSGYNALLMKRAFSIPLVTTFYGYDMSMVPRLYPEWKKRYAKLFERGERFLLEGSHMRDCLLESGCPPEKAVVQHLGIDLGRIGFAGRMPGGDEEVRVLVAGSFREKKGIPDAVEAFGRVSRENPSLRLRLTIIGDSPGSPAGEEEKRKIIRKIEEYRLSDKVNMLGYQKFPVFLEQLYKHHIFLSPSVTASDGDTEGGAPVSIIEASASGMPVLSTRHCDIPEVVLDGESGYLVPERDVDALAQRLRFLVQDPGAWEKMGLSGRRHIEKEYDVRKQARCLEEIYDSLRG